MEFTALLGEDSAVITMGEHTTDKPEQGWLGVNQARGEPKTTQCILSSELLILRTGLCGTGKSWALLSLLLQYHGHLVLKPPL